MLYVCSYNGLLDSSENERSWMNIQLTLEAECGMRENTSSDRRSLAV